MAMTEPRPWPNEAKEGRDRAAEEAMRGIRALRPIVDGSREMPAGELMRRVAIALDADEMIARHMERMGAQTRPD
jgi:hypothetical protein